MFGITFGELSCLYLQAVRQTLPVYPVFQIKIPLVFLSLIVVTSGFILFNFIDGLF